MSAAGVARLRAAAAAALRLSSTQQASRVRTFATGWALAVREAVVRSDAAEELVDDYGDDDGVDIADVNPEDLGLDRRRCDIRERGAPADDPHQRFVETAHRLRGEIPRLLEPAKLSADLLEPDVELRDNTMRMTFHGRVAHDLVLGAAAAGTRLALVDAEIRILSYSHCVDTRRITCRWQIIGSPRVPLTRVHHDRVSFFDVNDGGRVYRHTIDRISPAGTRRRTSTLRDALLQWRRTREPAVCL